MRYILHNSPVWIDNRWFKKIETLFRTLIWKKGKARISLRTLQLPTNKGGLAVPHPYSYFLAPQLQHLGGCSIEGGGNASGKMMLRGSPHSTVIETLEANSFLVKSPTVKMMVRIWQAGKLALGYKGLTEYSPLWENNNLKEIVAIRAVLALSF